ncbi:MAG TPA: GWxTD domain-containing protein [Thermoanaerobaculia bacterium]|nr:GWxTD domain-containing protein [Thermoanaerobaculia bacterium]
MNHLDFGKGPMQWLMTREEQRAWGKVRTAGEAREFVDLFWARRDPTPGTPSNELRTEIDSRVAYADARFKEGDLRGALTERGRVLIVLGFPKHLSMQAQTRTAQLIGGPDGVNALDPTGGRALAARDTWEYDHRRSVKFGMPKIEVVFVHDGMSDRVRRDPQRTDFTSALPRAINSYIVNPGLTAAPEWAASRASGLVLQASGERTSGERTDLPQAATAAAPAPAPASAPEARGPRPEAPVKPAGAGRLTLVHDAFLIDAQSGADPLASLTNVTKFGREGELGWAAEYCTGVAATELETVTVTVRVIGEGVTFTAPADELAPDSIRGWPGCHVVRGAIPLSEVDPGKYTLSVSIQSYNLTRDFRVE